MSIDASERASNVATYIDYSILNMHLDAIKDKINPGQQAIIENSRFNIQTYVNYDWESFGAGYNVVTSSVESTNFDFYIPHEEAFGDFFEVVKENIIAYNDKVFNYSYEGDFYGFFDLANMNREEAARIIMDKVAIFL